MPGFVRNTRRTLARLEAESEPSRRTHLIDLVQSWGWIMSNVLVQEENTTLKEQ